MHSHYVIMLRVPPSRSRVPAVSSIIIIIVSSSTSTFQSRWTVFVSSHALHDLMNELQHGANIVLVLSFRRPPTLFVFILHETRIIQIPLRQPSPRIRGPTYTSTEKRPTNRCVSNPFRQDLHTGIPSCQEPQQQLNDDMWECAV